ncbi:MAG: SH3 domain-containing protein [Proteobacteria bacterium]|nr:SH3 domain-containing protein [Pseudomonadota bacterium]
MALINESSPLMELLKSQQASADPRQAGAKSSDYLADQGGSNAQAQAKNSGTPMVVNVSSLNVRRGIGKKYGKVGVLSAGKVVNVLETKPNGWCRINFGTGEGWVVAKYLSPAGNASAKSEDSSSDVAASSASDVSESASVAAPEVSGNAEPAAAGNAVAEDVSGGAAAEEVADAPATDVGRTASVGDVMYVKSKVAQVYTSKTLGKRAHTLNVGSAVTVQETGEKGGEQVYKVRLNTKKVERVGWIRASDLTDQGAIGKLSEAKAGTGLASDVVKFATGKIGSKAYAKYEGGKLKMTYCQRFVKESANRAIGGMPAADSAYDAWAKWSVSSDQSKIPVGAAVYFDSATKNGSQNGHVGVHVGNDQIVHVAGAVKKQSLSQINSNGVHTFRAWGWQGGVPLKQPGE